MLLPESLVWAFDSDGCSAVKIYCSDDIKEEVAARFSDIFNEEYEKVMDLVEEDDGDCYEKEEELNPFLGAEITEYGVFLPFEALAMYCAEGDIIAQHDAGEALHPALEKIQNEYPAIRYEGYVGYHWSDIHSGEVCQYEVSSNNKNPEIYDFVGRALAFAFEDDAWDRIEEQLQFVDRDEYKRILAAFDLYSEWIPSDAKDRLQEIAEDLGEDISDLLPEDNGANDPGEEFDIEDEEADED